MKKILLICDMGMSTSLVVKRMQEAAKNQNAEVSIEARGSQDFESYVGDYDLFLVAPQISYKLSDFQSVVQPLGKKVELINMMDYGMTAGDKILSMALALLDD